MRIERLTVTPDMARDWLHMNARNRALRRPLVRQLEQAILRGEWKCTHQPIAIDTAGVLLDGQHRLTAILGSGVPCECLVAFDAERETFDCIDIGAKRSLGDVLNLPSDQASCLRFITNMMIAGNQVTPQQAEKYWPYIRQHVEALLGASSTKRRYVTTAPIMSAAVIRMLGGMDKQYVLSTWRALVLLDFAELPPVAASFLKQLMNNTTKKSIADRAAFKRAWIVFDADEQDRERLSVTDDDAITEAQATIITAMNMKIMPLAPQKIKKAR